MIFYIDEAKNSKTTDATTVCFFNAEKKAKNWNLDRYIDVIDAKLFAIEKAIESCTNRTQSIKIASDIWIFTDCANAITRLKKFEFRTQIMQKIHKNCKILYELDHKIHIHWISEHANISRNLQADEQAKKRLELIENRDDLMSFQYLNKRIELDKFEKWNVMWQNNSKKRKFYEVHNSNSQQIFFKKFSNCEKLLLSIFLQMKIEHDYFKSYLCRLLTYESNRCNEKCNETQTFEHLLLHYRHYKKKWNQMKNNIKIYITLRTLFNTNKNIKNVWKFIKNTWICTKKWILDTMKNEKINENEWKNLK